MSISYEIIKNTGKKYLLPLLVGAGIYFSGCTIQDYTALPIKQSVREAIIVSQREEVECLAEKYTKQLNTYVSNFNNSIQDRQLTSKEQKELTERLDCADKLRQTISCREKVIGEYYPLSILDDEEKEIRTMYGLLSKNVRDIDVGVPELQKKLEWHGLSVTVEPILSETESLLIRGIPIFLLSAMVATCLFWSYYCNRIKKDISEKGE